MALHNPSNLYSAGQVVLDSTPYARIAEQRRAKQQALDDTLYKYYSELPNKINPAGLRTIDQEGLNKRVENIGDFFKANSKEIIRGGSKKQQLDAMFQDAKQYVNQSKDTGLFQTKTGADYFKGKHRPRARDLEIMAAIERPIDDPAHYKNADIKQPYTYNDFSIAAPDFDANRQQQFDKAILGKTEPQILQGDKPRYDTDTYEVINNKKYRPEDVFNLAQKAAANISSDPSAYNFFEDQLDSPDQVKKASEALSKIAGVQVVAETPEQMAAGLKADQFMNFSKEDRKKDVDAVNKWREDQATTAFNRRLKAMGYSDELIRGRMKKAQEYKKTYYDYTKDQDRKSDEGIVTKYINIQKQDAPLMKYVTINGEKFGEGKFVQPTVTIADKFTIERDTPDGKYTEKVKPDAFYITDDNKNVIPVKFKRDAAGKVLKTPSGATMMDNRGFQPIPMQNYRTEVSKEIIQKKNQGPEIIDEFQGDDDPQYKEHLKVIETESTGTGTTEKKTSKWDKYKKQ